MKPVLMRRIQAQSLTELALIMPLLMLLLIGLIEVGFLLQAHVQVSSAAREAARAASLYAATRYAGVDANGNNVTSCDGTADGWSLQQTIDQAIVRRALANNGCPTTNGTITYSALGRLSPAQAAAGTVAPPCPTGSATGWVAGVSDTFTPNGEAMPPPGSEATVTLCYPYRLLLATDLFRWGSPIWINKSVVFTYQQ
jgi:Flp pilus assembly protein TadG